MKSLKFAEHDRDLDSELSHRCSIDGGDDDDDEATSPDEDEIGLQIRRRRPIELA